MKLRSTVGLILATALCLASPVRAESVLCMTGDKSEPVFLITGFKSDTPLLRIDSGTGLLIKNVPCVSNNVVGTTSCETPTTTSGMMEFFTFYGSEPTSGLSVRHYLVRPRDKPNNGVLLDVSSSESVAYTCRNTTLDEQ